MLEEQEDVFYYVTVMNENYAQPSLPAGATRACCAGMYRLSAPAARDGDATRVQLLGSGAILREVIAAAAVLEATTASPPTSGA